MAKRTSGSALMIALVVLGILGLFSLSYTAVDVSQQDLWRHHQLRTRALARAEGALALTLEELRRPDAPSGDRIRQVLGADVAIAVTRAGTGGTVRIEATASEGPQSARIVVTCAIEFGPDGRPAVVTRTEEP